MALEGGGGLAVTPAALLADLRRQLAIGEDRAKADPFGFGGHWNEVGQHRPWHGPGRDSRQVANLTGDPAPRLKRRTGSAP